ncbi:ABC transporter ATP-binding protein, partial [Streptomyces hainanensis]
PSLLSPPPGCPFEPRCGFTDEVTGPLGCATDRPELPEGRGAACHLTGERRHELFTTRIRPRLR